MRKRKKASKAKWVVLLLVAALVAGYVFYPDFFKQYLRLDYLKSLWAKLAGGGGQVAQVGPGGLTHFTELEGGVQIKKRNSARWQTAALDLELEEGDVIQTAPGGLARIAFFDGTTYVVRPNTMIVVEENARLASQATRVTVQVSFGAVNLSTGNWKAQGSRSVVRFENAVAQMRQNSSASVRQNPDAGIHEIMVLEGGSVVSKGGQTVEVGPNETASFRGREAPLVKGSAGASRTEPARGAEPPAAQPPATKAAVPEPAEPIEPEVISFELADAARISGVALEPGSYKLDIKSSGEALVYRRNEVVARTRVRVRSMASGITRSSVVVDPQGNIREIRTKKRIVVISP